MTDEAALAAQDEVTDSVRNDTAAGARNNAAAGARNDTSGVAGKNEADWEKAAGACRPRWMDVTDPKERQCAHILDLLGFCGHYMHVHGGGRSGRAPILCALRKHGAAMSQRELASRFELKAGSLSEALTKIEEAGLIVRTRDPQDRRQLIVSLTPDGVAKADEDQLERERFRAEAFACLSDEERTHLEDMLARITKHWRTLDD